MSRTNRSHKNLEQRTMESSGDLPRERRNFEFNGNGGNYGDGSQPFGQTQSGGIGGYGGYDQPNTYDQPNIYNPQAFDPIYDTPIIQNTWNTPVTNSWEPIKYNVPSYEVKPYDMFEKKEVFPFYNDGHISHYKPFVLGYELPSGNEVHFHGDDVNHLSMGHVKTYDGEHLGKFNAYESAIIANDLDNLGFNKYYPKIKNNFYDEYGIKNEINNSINQYKYLELIKIKTWDDSRNEFI